MDNCRRTRRRSRSVGPVIGHLALRALIGSPAAAGEHHYEHRSACIPANIGEDVLSSLDVGRSDWDASGSVRVVTEACQGLPGQEQEQDCGSEYIEENGHGGHGGGNQGDGVIELGGKRTADKNRDPACHTRGYRRQQSFNTSKQRPRWIQMNHTIRPFSHCFQNPHLVRLGSSMLRARWSWRR